MEEAVLVGNGEDVASDSVASTPGAQATAAKAAMEATTTTIRAFTEILPSVFTVDFGSSPAVDTETNEHQKSTQTPITRMLARYLNKVLARIAPPVSEACTAVELRMC